jgi:ABC-2 type transport system ATP-binding protein
LRIFLFHRRFTWSKQSRCRCIIAKHEEFFNGEILKTKIFTRFIKGNQKKVGIIPHGNPEVIILDEPFANLDQQRNSDLKKIKDLAADPNVTLVSSHDLLHTVEVSDPLSPMHKVVGHSNFTRTLQELEQFFLVKTIFLGHDR